LCLVLGSGLCKAQQSIAFDHLSTINGLTDNYVVNTTLDKNGFLWIATTEGLNRFDGHSVEHFYKEDYPELGNNNIREIVCDDNNRLWIRTFNGFIAMLDEHRRWHAIPITDSGKNQPIYNILKTKSRGIVLFKGDKQFVQDKSNPLSFHRWRFDDDTVFNRHLHYPEFLSDDKVIWTATDVLFVMDYVSGKIVLKKPILNISSAAAYTDKEVLVTTGEDGGIFKMELANGKLQHLDGLKDQYNMIPFGDLRKIRRMANGDYIIITGYAGVYTLSMEQQKLWRYFHDPLNIRSIATNTCSNLVADTSGYVFIASPTTGVSFFDVEEKPANWQPYFKNDKNEVFDGYINAIIQDTQGNFWLTGFDKLIKWNRKSNTIQFIDYLKNNQNKQDWISNEINTMCLGPQGHIWIGTNGSGLIEMDNAGKILKKLGGDDPFSALAKFGIAYMTYANGRIWLATNAGIRSIDPITYQLYEPDATSLLKQLQDKVINNIWFDKKGRMWIGTRRNGAYRYEAASNQWKQFSAANGLSNINVLSFAEDINGNIYVGTYNGLNVLKGDSVIKIYNRRNGLRGDRCESILKDHADRLWIENDNCIIRFDPATQVFRIFDEKSGLGPYGFRGNAALRAADGELFFGGEKGVSHFYPNVLDQNSKGLRVSITQVDVVDSSIQLAMEEELTFPKRYNNITFHFSAIDLSGSHNIFYRYQLEGADKEWITALDIKEVRYNALLPGTYTMQLQASADGVIWNHAAFPLKVEILPAFWQTWWFKALVILLITILIGYILKRREARIREKEKLDAREQRMKADALQYQLEVEQVVNYFATSLSGLYNVDDILWDVVNNCIGKLGFEDCVIYLLDKEKNILVQKAAHGPKNIDNHEIFNRIEIALGSGIVGTVGQTGVPEIIGDTSKDARYIPDDAVRLSEIAIPITYEREILGVIDSENKDKYFYNEKHLHILGAIATMVGNKLEQIKTQQASEQQELKLANTQRDLATSQLTATRVQMNPHFIFNALNSVQQYILQGDVDEANKYLSKFAKLQREILNHCDQQFISLQKEIDMLIMYLEFERLRFDDGFYYSLAMDDNIDPEEIMIPPMILQPFAENGIWHGLMPKTGDRELDIDFRLQGEDYLICIISDNGIGRKAAANIKAIQQSKHAINHISKGLNLVHDRLRLMQEQYGGTFKASIADMVAPDGQSLGTRIEIMIFIGH